MIKLFKCEICADPYLGEEPPVNCPYCGAHTNFIKEAKDAQIDFNIELSETEKSNVKHALELEISNAAFYLCAAKKTDDKEGKLLFHALGKVEAEHASILKKILKLDSIPKGNDECFIENKKNLEESHKREENAIKFYKKFAKESDHPFLKKTFAALIVIENDHLKLSEERLL